MHTFSGQSEGTPSPLMAAARATAPAKDALHATVDLYLEASTNRREAEK